MVSHTYQKDTNTNKLLEMQNANYEINNPEFLLGIVKKIESSIGRNLSDIEENNALDYITNNVPRHYFSQYKKDKINMLVSDSAIKALKLETHVEFVDTHEMLKNNLSNLTVEERREIKLDNANNVEVNVDNILGIRDISTLVKQLRGPIQSINTVYLTLDSRYRILESDGKMSLRWGHINSITRGQGTVNSLGNIRDIISMKLMPFRLPNTSSSNTYYKKITVLIEELATQSIIAHEDRRYHFIGDVEVISPTILAIEPDKYFKREFKFNKPITSLNTVSLSLGSPLEPIILEPDRLTATISTYALLTTIEFDAVHNLVTSDIIYIDNFTTINHVFDAALINNINNKIGNSVTVTTPTSVTIAIDSTEVQSAVAGTVTAPSTLLAGTITVTTNSATITGIGTSFTTDFVVGDYIDIIGDTSNIYQISSISTNTNLTLTKDYIQSSGVFSYRLTGVVLNGLGTNFRAVFNPGDKIIIADGVTNPEFIVKTIASDTKLTLTLPYNGVDGAGFTVTKDNTIDNTLQIFLGSKRIFFNLEVTYLST